MLFDAEQAIILQQVAHRLDFCVRDVPVHHIVHHAHHKDAVERPLCTVWNFAERKGVKICRRTSGHCCDISRELCNAGRDAGFLLIAKMAFRAEIQAGIFAFFVHITAKDTRNPFATRRIFADDVVRVQTEKFERFGRVAILVALGIGTARRVGENFCKARGVLLMHFVMLGFAHAVMVGIDWGCKRSGGEGN